MLVYSLCIYGLCHTFFCLNYNYFLLLNCWFGIRIHRPKKAKRIYILLSYNLLLKSLASPEMRYEIFLYPKSTTKTNLIAQYNVQQSL